MSKNTKSRGFGYGGNARAATAEPNAPNVAPQERHEEAKEDDAGDSRQYLNVVFIGHVGTDLVPASSLLVLLVLRDRSACTIPHT